MNKHRQKKKRRKISRTAVIVVAAGAVGIPSVALASGSELGGLRSVASSWLGWGGGTSDQVADAEPSRTPSASPDTPKASPSPRTTPAKTRKASPSASKSPSPTPTRPRTKPDRPAPPPSTPTPKTTRPSKAPSAPASPADSGPTSRVLALVNAEREKAGCGPVTTNAKLTKAAQNHSQDMADHKNMSHTGSDGSDMGERLARVGYNFRSAGENVAAGYGTPESVMDGWMNSPGHKANILNCGFKELGIGLAQPGNYWTQNFGS
ncbi:CAP domain-containing protein [Streptomyces sp. NBC_00286]|uniref:CAP domain-containing protein n=1 Tax=Streptomyces sp. NBC_00286 TaxID=2975701 RepID=UPI002E2E1DEA|nr:CAP domain-containing protein [Streptomyces sp. NBC_00286]